MEALCVFFGQNKVLCTSSQILPYLQILLVLAPLFDWRSTDARLQLKRRCQAEREREARDDLKKGQRSMILYSSTTMHQENQEKDSRYVETFRHLYSPNLYQLDARQLAQVTWLLVVNWLFQHSGSAYLFSSLGFWIFWKTPKNTEI